MPINISGTTLGQSTKDATALPSDVVNGKIFYAANGKQIGTLNYKKSLILADNVNDLELQSGVSSITLNWSIPNSEIAIDEFNIYLAKQETIPSSLNEFEKIATVDASATSYTIDGLEEGMRYYIVVESVSIEGYENASLRGRRSFDLSANIMILASSYNGDNPDLYFCNDGATWRPLKNPGAVQVTIPKTTKRIISVEEKFYTISYNEGVTSIIYINQKTGNIVESKVNIWDKQCCDISYTGKRFISISGGPKSMLGKYTFSYPEETTDWVQFMASNNESTSTKIASHNDILVMVVPNNNVVLIKNFNSNMNTEYSAREYTNVTYGGGRYIFSVVINGAMPSYITEENITSGTWVSMGTNNTGVFRIQAIIYCEEKKCFFCCWYR